MLRTCNAILFLLLLIGCNEPQRAVLAEGRVPDRLPTTSMEPTISRHDYVFSRPIVNARTVRRHDIVIYRLPADEKTRYVKRVVGLPGETLEVRNKTVYVGGAPLEEAFAAHRDATIYAAAADIPEPFRSRDNFGPMDLKHDEVFVLGDNRDESFDSRYHGPVANRLLIALVDKVGPRKRKLGSGPENQLFTARRGAESEGVRWNKRVKPKAIATRPRMVVMPGCGRRSETC